MMTATLHFMDRNFMASIDTKRPMILNPDGSFSTEKTITIRRGDKFINIPTIINGQEVPVPEAIQHAEVTGQNFGVFDSIKEAEASAQQRSKAIGRLRALEALMAQQKQQGRVR